MDIQAIGILSANTVGTGLAEICLKSGCQVRIYDNFKDSLDVALAKIAWSMRRAGKEALLSNIEGIQDLSRFKGADIVLETMAQDPDTRRLFYSKLKEAVDPGCIIAAYCPVQTLKSLQETADLPKDRTLGINFVRPVSANALAELVRLDSTKEEYIESVMALLRKIGKTPVLVKDNPGQIVERLRRPFILGAFRLLEAGKGDPDEIDGAFREISGASAGPFEIADFIGLDRDYKATQDIYEALGKPERLAPPALELRFVQYGQLGKKSTIGLYIYEDGRIVGQNPILPTVVKYLGLRKVAREEIFGELMKPVVEEARLLASEIMASEHDIETAVKLALNWPKGPFAYSREFESLFVKKRSGEFDDLDSY